MNVSTPPFDMAFAQDELQRRGLHAKLHWVAEVDSTNRWAIDQAEQGEPAFTWFVADRQTQGRGRLGRAWLSPPGRNLYASVILRPSLASTEAPTVGLAMALAAVRALKACGANPQIKWPNDLQVAGKKVAGILCEARFEPAAAPQSIACIVAGFGINVAMKPGEFPPELSSTATSLHAVGVATNREQVFAELASAVEAVMEQLAAVGFISLCDEWNAASALTGRFIEVLFGNESRQGTVLGIDRSGRLLLLTSSGLEPIVAGDVSVKK